MCQNYQAGVAWKIVLPVFKTNVKICSKQPNCSELPQASYGVSKKNDVGSCVFRVTDQIQQLAPALLYRILSDLQKLILMRCRILFISKGPKSAEPERTGL